MNRVETLSEKFRKLGDLRPNERVEFDADGSVHLARGWKRTLKRKTLNNANHSRRSTYNGFLSLLDLSNDIISGILEMPPIRVNCLNIGAHDPKNVRESKGCMVNASGNVEKSQKSYFAACDDKMLNCLKTLADGLYCACSAINTLCTSTYVNDSALCGSLMKLINYASLQRERIEDAQRSRAN